MNNKELDLETEWEQLVNHPHVSGDSPAFKEDKVVARAQLLEDEVVAQAQRIYESIREKRRSKIVLNFIYCGIGAAAFGALYCTGLLPAWIGLTAFVILACMASCSVGRLIEMNRR